MFAFLGEFSEERSCTSNEDAKDDDGDGHDESGAVERIGGANIARMFIVVERVKHELVCDVDGCVATCVVVDNELIDTEDIGTPEVEREGTTVWKIRN